MFPGSFYDPQDFATATVEMVKNQMGGYKPGDFETEVVDPQDGGPVAPPLDPSGLLAADLLFEAEDLADGKPETW
jgi:hypothetical protein